MPKDRDTIIDELAQKWTDDMDMDDLMDFFYDHQVASLEQKSEKELAELAEENDIE